MKRKEQRTYHDSLAVASERVLKELREHRVSVRDLHLHSAQCTIKGAVPRDFRLQVFLWISFPPEKNLKQKISWHCPYNLFSPNGNLQRHVRTRSAGNRNTYMTLVFLQKICGFFSFSLHWFFQTWGVKRCLVKKYNLYFRSHYSLKVFTLSSLMYCKV